MRKLTEKQLDREIEEFCMWLVDFHELPEKSRETVKQNLKLTVIKLGVTTID